MTHNTPTKPDQPTGKPGNQQPANKPTNKPGDQGQRRTAQPDTQNRPIEVPGRPDADRMTERKPAYGPGGGQPQDGAYGTEASEKPGAIDTPYADDDMNGRNNAEA